MNRDPSSFEKNASSKTLTGLLVIMKTDSRHTKANKQINYKPMKKTKLLKAEGVWSRRCDILPGKSLMATPRQDLTAERRISW